MSMRRYWLSWLEAGEDPRPIMFPAPRCVVAWWCSGTGELNGSPCLSICAVVDAVDDVDAKAGIATPGGWMPIGWRFCERRPDGWMPDPGRFPPPDIGIRIKVDAP